ncbi:MAG: hypothetical protein E6J90_42935 [Deltaproteobacteria bacterium]|nr:MAG: hypothetical protein E6J90_42935 [Deltaproteobacteria bacterium]
MHHEAAAAVEPRVDLLGQRAQAAVGQKEQRDAIARLDDGPAIVLQGRDHPVIERVGADRDEVNAVIRGGNRRCLQR